MVMAEHSQEKKNECAHVGITWSEVEGDNTCVERMKLSVQKDHTHPPKAGGWKPHQW